MIVQVKIDEIQKQFSDLKNRVDDSLEQMEEALPLAQHFQAAHEEFQEWLSGVEPALRAKEPPMGPEAEEEVQVRLRADFGRGWGGQECLIVSWCQQIAL